MNFLAHLYLSGNNNDIRIGNFIGDHVKGSRYNNYPDDIRKGILLHRAIDDFTDKHPIVKEHIKLFKPGYARYAGVVTDIVYDHILTNEWHQYSDRKLGLYAAEIYAMLLRRRKQLPSSVKSFLPFLIASNRLVSYRKVSGVQSALAIMARYRNVPLAPEFLALTLSVHKEKLTLEFAVFFRQLIDFVKENYEIGELP